MASPPTSTQRFGRARTGAIGTLIAAVAFFDALCLGLPIAVLAASFRPLIVLVAAATGVSLISIACCSWVDQRWDEWSSGNSRRLERRLEGLRESRLMARPVAWIQSGSDRSYALAAAIVNPILVVALLRPISGESIGRHRIVLGSVAYAIPYVAMWSLLGVLMGSTVRAV